MRHMVPVTFNTQERKEFHNPIRHQAHAKHVKQYTLLVGVDHSCITLTIQGNTNLFDLPQVFVIEHLVET